MKRLALLLLTCAATSAHFALAQDVGAALRAGCSADVQKFCSNVQPGGGRIIACLKANKDNLSDQCKQAARAAANAAASSRPSASVGGTPNGASNPAVSSAGGFANSATPAAAAPTGVPAAKPTTSSSSSSHRAPTTASKTAPGSYLLLKKVQLNDPGTMGHGAQPAYDLLIPPTWELKGTVTLAGGKGGCFSDLMAVHWEATSPDGALAFQGAPNYSWQYTNDPTEFKKLNDPNRRQTTLPGQPTCPVAKPMKAEDYFRQTVLPALPSGTKVVSIEPLDELNQLVRRQLGLAPTDSGNGAVRVEAIRARTEGQKEGKPVEAWVSMAVVTRAFQVGQGTFWNCSAIDFMALRAPRGQLDANDKLFKVMITSVRPEPKWQAEANAAINKFYQAEANKEATQDKIIADFQRKVASTIMATTANAQRGANQAAFGEGQIIRGVQTFRDPSTGNTMELSNQYDHAWLNGNNEYVMSDDANFNPNSQLSGSWNQLQVVRPSP